MASIFPAGQQMEPNLYVKRMSNHLSAALLVFALLQIFIVTVMGGSSIRHFGVILLIALIVPCARAMERKWRGLGSSGLPVADLSARFRRDLAKLWLVALVTPFLWYPVGLLLGGR